MGSNDERFRRLRRDVRFAVMLGGFLFVPLVVVNNPTGVGVLGGVPGMGAVGFAIASSVTGTKQHEIEYLWTALALLTFGIVAVVFVHWVWL